jgi:hypothetical protein
MDAQPPAQDRGLGDQRDVPAFQVHVLVGRVLGGRRARDGPVFRGVHIAEIDRERSQGRDAGERRVPSSRSIARRSSSSHANPERTCTGCAGG